MNLEKAREYFSSYHEGTLDGPLRQSFEQRMKADANLRADYAAFVATMDDLAILPDEEIEIPIYLRDRIATRLEMEQQTRRSTAPIWTLRLRNLAFGALGCVAIFGAVRSLTSTGGDSTHSGPDGGDGGQMTFKASGSSVELEYRPMGDKTIIVSSAISGREIQRMTANSSSKPFEFKNELAGTSLFQVQVEGESNPAILAVPGRGPAMNTTGDGTVRDFAVALAGRYHVPVIIRAMDVTRHLMWKLSEDKATQAASDALRGTPYNVDQLDSGLVSITDR